MRTKIMLKGAKERILAMIADCGEEGAMSSEIEGKVKLERHTMSKYLSVMEKEGILAFRQIGKGRLWFVNKAPLQRLHTSKEQTFTEKLILNLTSKIPAGIIVMDKDYNVQFVNDIVAKRYGHITGEKFYKSVLGMKSHGTLRKINSLINGSVAAVELKITDRLHNILLIKCSELANPDGSASVIMIAEDITDKEMAEEKLERSYEKLKEIDSIKSAVLRDVARDLKQPVSLVTITASLLLEEIRKESVDRQKLEHYLKILHRNSLMFEEQLSAILQLSRVVEKDGAEKENVSVPSVIRRIAEDYGKVAEEKGLELKTRISDVEITANRELVSTLIRNLVSNAIRFTDKGCVEIGCLAENGSAVITVSDTGIGIGTEDSERIFQPFFKADRSSEGIGVGLAICKEIAGMYNGRIGLSSAAGKGSTFTVTLPIRR